MIVVETKVQFVKTGFHHLTGWEAGNEAQKLTFLQIAPF